MAQAAMSFVLLQAAECFCGTPKWRPGGGTASAAIPGQRLYWPVPDIEVGRRIGILQAFDQKFQVDRGAQAARNVSRHLRMGLLRGNTSYMDEFLVGFRAGPPLLCLSQTDALFQELPIPWCSGGPGPSSRIHLCGMMLQPQFQVDLTWARSPPIGTCWQIQSALRTISGHFGGQMFSHLEVDLCPLLGLSDLRASTLQEVKVQRGMANSPGTTRQLELGLSLRLLLLGLILSSRLKEGSTLFQDAMAL